MIRTTGSENSIEVGLWLGGGRGRGIVLSNTDSDERSLAGTSRYGCRGRGRGRGVVTTDSSTDSDQGPRFRSQPFGRGRKILSGCDDEIPGMSRLSPCTIQIFNAYITMGTWNK